MLDNTNYQNILPESWCQVKHEEIASINPKLNSEEISDELEVSFLPMAAVEEKTGRFDLSDIRQYGKVKKGYTQFANGDLLFAKITPCMENGKVVLVGNLVNGIGCGSTEFHVSRPIDLVNRKYLFFYFVQEEFRRDAQRNMTGSAGQLRVPKSFFAEARIPFPPLAEQQRIVDKIEELFSDLDSGIDSLKKAKQQLKVYRQAVLKWAFEGKLTAQWREEQQRQGKLESADTLLAKIKAEREQRYQKELEVWQAEVEAWDAIGKEGKKPRKPSQVKVPEPLSKTEIGSLWSIPKNWRWGKLGEFFRVYVGSTPSRKREDYWNGDIPWVSSGEVSFCRIQKTEETITLEGLLNSSTEKHPPGTIMLGMIGEGKTRGQSAILDIAAAHNQNTAAIRVSETECIPKILFYYFYFQYQRTREIGSGNNQKALNKSRVEGIAYPLMPGEEQHEILAEIESRLSICDQIEADIETNLKKAEALRQSILKQAFEGKLVPQDPNDEPASVLLERIRAEREAEKKNGDSKIRDKPEKEKP